MATNPYAGMSLRWIAAAIKKTYDEIARLEKLVEAYTEATRTASTASSTLRSSVEASRQLAEAIQKMNNLRAAQLAASGGVGSGAAGGAAAGGGGAGGAAAAGGVVTNTLTSIGSIFGLSGPAAFVVGGLVLTAVLGGITYSAATYFGSHGADKPVQPVLVFGQPPGSVGLPVPEAPKRPEGSITSGSLPSTMTVKHRTDLVWPLTLRFVKQEPGGAGRYEGKGFDGSPATGTLLLLEDARFSLTVEIPSKSGGAWQYEGQRSGNSAEGKYYPPGGFGPVSYFKAEW